MSSYQFVNSLTSCYGQPRAGPDSGSSAAPDYYTPQAYNSCYANAANAVSAAAPQPASPPYSAYIQQNGDHHHSHSSHSAHHHPYSSNSCSQVATAAQSRLSHHATQVIPSSRTPTSPSSCKYAVDSASSPQDLSTSSGGAGQSPEPRASPPQSQTRGANSGSGQASNTPTGQSGGTQGAGQQNQGKNGNYSSGNPPHIYPWMRKVHVGQSKC